MSLRLALIAIPCLGLAVPAAAQIAPTAHYGTPESRGYRLPTRTQQEPPPPGWEQATPNLTVPQTPGGVATATTAPAMTPDPASSFLGGVPGAPLNGMSEGSRASIFGTGSSFSGALTAPRSDEDIWSPALGDAPLSKGQ
jgi:hypothetical protein